ncbi:hypothetical protein [Sulfobacillus thermosulfidooxidans]|uniref:hypothetical protein n=1 Tax=Sulfobacillus thermosulfidooxidans TaxID=28034 RepID=UPI00111193AA|nr:hypothetical protein [Sulfobacillus thermosulfidooxidans]
MTNLVKIRILLTEESQLERTGGDVLSSDSFPIPLDLVQPLADSLPSAYEQVWKELHDAVDKPHFNESLNAVRRLYVARALESAVKAHQLPFSIQYHELAFGFKRLMLVCHEPAMILLECFIGQDQNFPYPSRYRDELRALWNLSWGNDLFSEAPPRNPSDPLVAYLAYTGRPPYLESVFVGIPHPIHEQWADRRPLKINPRALPEETPDKLPMQSKVQPPSAEENPS